MTTAIVAEKSGVHPRYYDPGTPRIVWYYRVLTLHNLRVDAEAYHRRKQERQRRQPAGRR